MISAAVAPASVDATRFDLTKSSAKLLATKIYS
jgi:hypothetical protein